MTLSEDKIDLIIKKVKFVIKVTLMLCLSFSLLLLLLVLFDNDFMQTDEINATSAVSIYIAEIIAYGTFYLFIWATIPSAILLTSIFVYNKFKAKPNWPFIKSETILLISNILIIAIIFIIVAIFWKEEHC